MSNLIDREKLLARFEQFGREIDKDVVLDVIRSMPSGLLHCKDCEWFGNIGCAISIVDESDEPKETDYCSFGEPKRGDSE